MTTSEEMAFAIFIMMTVAFFIWVAYLVVKEYEYTVVLISVQQSQLPKNLQLPDSVQNKLVLGYRKI